MRLSRLIPVAVVALSAFGCDGQTPPPNDPSNPNPGQYNPGQYPPSTTTATYPGTTSTTPAPSTTAAAAQATPLAPAALLAADPILQGLATTEAPGAQPDGSSFGGQFQEGQQLEQNINIQAGKCYTIVATSLGPITELDVMIQGQLMPGTPSATVAQDNQQGPTAVLGSKANGCWRNPAPFPVPGKVVLKATKGNGVAAARIFVKN